MQLSIEEFAELLLSGSHGAALERLNRYRENGLNRLFLCEQLITPAMRYIGNLWENNQISVADEHLASGVCDWLLEKIGPVHAAGDNRPMRAMLFCIEGEQHDLGLKMCASLFREYHWDVRYYGSNLPLQHAWLSSLSWKPDVIAMSFSRADQIDQLRSYIEAFEQSIPKPRIMIGSRLMNDYDLRPHVSADTILVNGLIELADWLVQHSSYAMDKLRSG